MPEADVEPLDGGDAWAPNQVAMDLLRRAQGGEVEAVAVITRAPDGQLVLDWSAPMGVAWLCEMARYFQLTADEALLESNEILPEDQP